MNFSSSLVRAGSVPAKPIVSFASYAKAGKLDVLLKPGKYSVVLSDGLTAHIFSSSFISETAFSDIMVKVETPVPIPLLYLYISLL